jgi:hypothetical protein
MAVNGSRILGVAGALLLGGALLTLSACGKAKSTTPTSPTAPDTSNSAANVTATFTANPGVHMDYRVTGPGKITFTVTGVDDDEPDSRAIVYFYDFKGWTGGRGGAGFNGELRNHKFKWYDANGKIRAETYHGTVFHSRDTHNVVVEWSAGGMNCAIDGRLQQWGGPVAFPFTLGIGWPPGIRGGFAGAVYTNVVWPEGATKL